MKKPAALSEFVEQTSKLTHLIDEFNRVVSDLAYNQQLELYNELHES